MTHLIVHQKKISYVENLLNDIPRAIKEQLPEHITIICLSPEQSLKLNWRYRKKRKPANVLSFSYGPDYGEIILCPMLVYKEAKKQGNTQVFQMTWMVLHGMLHLAGLHHELSKTAHRRTSQIENAVLLIRFGKKLKKRD